MTLPIVAAAPLPCLNAASPRNDRRGSVCSPYSRSAAISPTSTGFAAYSGVTVSEGIQPRAPPNVPRPDGIAQARHNASCRKPGAAWSSNPDSEIPSRRTPRRGGNKGRNRDKPISSNVARAAIVSSRDRLRVTV